MKNRTIQVLGSEVTIAFIHEGDTGNMRDAATLEQLVVLSNLESINAVLIHQGLPAAERLSQLNEIAISQMRSLTGNNAIQQLPRATVRKGIGK